MAWMATILLLALAALAAWTIRCRRKKRWEGPEYDIPNFLTGRKDPEGFRSRRVDEEWCEIYPAPKPRPRRETKQ